MKTILVAAALLISQAAFAGPMCDKQTSANKEQKPYAPFTQWDAEISQDIEKIKAIKGQPARFAFNVVAGTGLRALKGANEGARQTVQYVDRLVNYAINSGACTLDAAKSVQVFQGVNCVIQLGGSAVTLSLNAAGHAAGTVIVTVYDLTSNIVGSTSELSLATAAWLRSMDKGSMGAGHVVAVPFWIVGKTLEAGNVVLKIVLIDVARNVVVGVADGVAYLACGRFEAVDALLARGDVPAFVKGMTIGVLQDAARGIKGIKIPGKPGTPVTYDPYDLRGSR